MAEGKLNSFSFCASAAIIPAPQAPPSELSLEARLFDGLARGLSLRQSMEEVVAQGERKNAVYAASLRVKQLMENAK